MICDNGLFLLSRMLRMLYLLFLRRVYFVCSLNFSMGYVADDGRQIPAQVSRTAASWSGIFSEVSAARILTPFILTNHFQLCTFESRVLKLTYRQRLPLRSTVLVFWYHGLWTNAHVVYHDLERTVFTLEFGARNSLHRSIANLNTEFQTPVSSHSILSRLSLWWRLVWQTARHIGLALETNWTDKRSLISCRVKMRSDKRKVKRMNGRS